MNDGGISSGKAFRRPFSLYASSDSCTKKGKCALPSIDKDGTRSYFYRKPFLLEISMIYLSDAARQELEAFFADKPKAGIRVYLAPGG